ncbi:MAG: PIN domain-containing protein [Solirubrobacterales bacterium]|nr:PIN domain-containing protein [Solirubrobacterales bacterium]
MGRSGGRLRGDSHGRRHRGRSSARSTARSSPAACEERRWPRRSSSAIGVSGAGISACRFSAFNRLHSASWPDSSNVLPSVNGHELSGVLDNRWPLTVAAVEGDGGRYHWRDGHLTEDERRDRGRAAGAGAAGRPRPRRGRTAARHRGAGARAGPRGGRATVRHLHRDVRLGARRPERAGQPRCVRAAAISLIFDTAVLVGAFDRGDDEHASCSALVEGARERRVIPSPVLVEVDHLLGEFAGEQAFVAVLDQVRCGAFVVEDLIARDYERVGELLRTYADLKVGFVDCAVLAQVERLGEPKLATCPVPRGAGAAAQLSRPGIGSSGRSPWISARPSRSLRSRGRSLRRLKPTMLRRPATRKSMSSVARTKRLAIRAKPPITTKRAPSPAIAAAAASSSGSGALIGPLHRAQQSGRLRGETLAAAQQFGDRGVGRWHQRLPLFGVQPPPLGLVAGLEQRLTGMRSHRHR